MDRRHFFKKTAVTIGAVALSKIASATKLVGIEKEAIESQNRKSNNMKIVVLTGSPRRKGNSAYLADNFIKGAEESGHSVYRFDSAFKDVKPCIACNRCGMNGDCVFKDDFTTLRPHLIEADMVVFATPMYYFGVSAQLKTVIDRFYAINGKIKGARKKCAYLMTYANTSASDAVAMKQHYQTLSTYLGWDSVGEVIASGVWTEGDIKGTKYPEQAYLLGKKL